MPILCTFLSVSVSSASMPHLAGLLSKAMGQLIPLISYGLDCTHASDMHFGCALEGNFTVEFSGEVFRYTSYPCAVEREVRSYIERQTTHDVYHRSHFCLLKIIQPRRTNKVSFPLECCTQTRLCSHLPEMLQCLQEIPGY